MASPPGSARTYASSRSRRTRAASAPRWVAAPTPPRLSVQANESRFGATMGGSADAAPAFIASAVKNLTSNQGNVNGDKFDNLGDQSKVVTDPGAAEATESLYLFPTDSNHNLV